MTSDTKCSNNFSNLSLTAGGNKSDATSTHFRPTEWVSKTLELPGYPRGCHVIHRQLLQNLPEIAEFEVGFAQFFIQHTSASLTISENASSDVPLDLADALDKLAPDGMHYRHSDEGPDDMPAHIKSCLMGPSLMLPIAQGRLALGIWQGIYLNEHRNYGGPRKIVVTIQGQKRADGRKYSQYQ
ncbi:MAG: secondary thiamine-phosphate synthase enzyme YjbQ [Taibaiella sp.]|nr:secondary thiamine-phosphate synthase enzyme YjbQ [Taibaiella sp.]MBX9448670.1 secondary thiamine-phosphate synthase enzyme YjbQ [Taibaiella sp.]